MELFWYVVNEFSFNLIADTFEENNQLTTFPVQPSMTEFYGDRNKLTSFPIQPNMVNFFLVHDEYDGTTIISGCSKQTLYKAFLIIIFK
jgi:hypothetical protein